jgi:meiotically up-regulated gene 157 (Mug157) protein
MALCGRRRGRELALNRVEATRGRDGQLHESVDPFHPKRYSRRWVAWADKLYVEVVLASAGTGVPAAAG